MSPGGARRQDAPQEKPQPRVDTPLAAAKARVLLIDGNADWLTAAGDWLTRRPDVVLAGMATSQGDALRALDAHGADLVLLDLSTPGADVYEFTRRLAIRPGAPAVVLLTLINSAAARAAALEAGAVALWHKSSILEQLPLLVTAWRSRGAPGQ